VLDGEDLEVSLVTVSSPPRRHLGAVSAPSRRRLVAVSAPSRRRLVAVSSPACASPSRRPLSRRGPRGGARRDEEAHHGRRQTRPRPPAPRQPRVDSEETPPPVTRTATPPLRPRAARARDRRRPARRHAVRRGQGDAHHLRRGAARRRGGGRGRLHTRGARAVCARPRPRLVSANPSWDHTPRESAAAAYHM
jgi:hypothetical protein